LTPSLACAYSKENIEGKRSMKPLSRREFMGRSAVAEAGMVIVPRHVLGGRGYQAPSDTLIIGCVGVGGKGSSDILSVGTERIAALCDVDDLMMAQFMGSAGTPRGRE